MQTYLYRASHLRAKNTIMLAKIDSKNRKIRNKTDYLIRKQKKIVQEAKLWQNNENAKFFENYLIKQYNFTWFSENGVSKVVRLICGSHNDWIIV